MLNINVMIAKVKMKGDRVCRGNQRCRAAAFTFHVVGTLYVDVMFSSNLCHKALESRDQFGLLGKPQSQEVEWIGSN